MMLALICLIVWCALLVFFSVGSLMRYRKLRAWESDLDERRQMLDAREAGVEKVRREAIEAQRQSEAFRDEGFNLHMDASARYRNAQATLDRAAAVLREAKDVVKPTADAVVAAAAGVGP